MEASPPVASGRPPATVKPVARRGRPLAWAESQWLSQCSSWAQARPSRVTRLDGHLSSRRCRVLGLSLGCCCRCLLCMAPRRQPPRPYCTLFVYLFVSSASFPFLNSEHSLAPSCTFGVDTFEHTHTHTHTTSKRHDYANHNGLDGSLKR